MWMETCLRHIFDLSSEIMALARPWIVSTSTKKSFLFVCLKPEEVKVQHSKVSVIKHHFVQQKHVSVPVISL